ncbi:MAG TPA: FtsQ-type POTRA domain-containing protein [Arenicellales bacterium]|nr:FtsQ-type POTRA domain-containing protein [Arenicellales bacterium]
MSARALEKLHRRRRAAKRRRIRRATLGWATAGLMLLALIGVMADRLMDPASFPIRELTFEGEFEHLDKEALRERVAAAVDANYFGADLEAIERAAESLDWVQRAQVRRVWPDGLRVRVEEHRLVARWGSKAWLNDRGEVVEMSAPRQSELLRLAGPEGSAGTVLERARQWGRVLAGAGLELKALTLNDRRAWYAVVAREQSGEIFSVALGRDGVPLRFERFVKAYAALPAEKTVRIDHVDARYPNGIALRLKQEMNS